jgi:hypothetical protein
MEKFEIQIKIGKMRTVQVMSGFGILSGSSAMHLGFAIAYSLIKYPNEQ